MAFQVTAAKSSRVQKNYSKNPLGGRLAASPLQRRGKQGAKSKKTREDSVVDEDDELFDTPLENLGLISTLATDLRFRDVPQQLQYIQDSMFEDIPERAGMNSTRIAEVLNFRKNLPPVVSSAHVHALSRSSTVTEREIAELVRKGVIRKVSIPGRGLGASAIGDCLALTERWIDHVQRNPALDDASKKKYIQALRERPGAATISASHFTQAELAGLSRAGYLTFVSSASLSFHTDAGAKSVGTLPTVATAGSRAAAGSIDAVGGSSAIYDAGGGGSALSVQETKDYGPEVTFTLPSMGPYLRLLELARNHIVALVSAPKFKQAPKSLLRERWNGNVTKKQRAKGLEREVLAGKTKKWRQFYGLKFDWILEECMGTGLVEIFETGSVGHGVKLP